MSKILMAVFVLVIVSLAGIRQDTLLVIKQDTVRIARTMHDSSWVKLDTLKPAVKAKK
jgi:hypothetical protein